jgi:hypothetical protein
MVWAIYYGTRFCETFILILRIKPDIFEKKINVISNINFWKAFYIVASV